MKRERERELHRCFWEELVKAAMSQQVLAPKFSCKLYNMFSVLYSIILYNREFKVFRESLMLL